jgi:hypothetical protein
MTIKPTTKRHILLGCFSLVNSLAAIFFWLANENVRGAIYDNVMSIYWGSAAIIFAVMGYACLKPAKWARKWSLFTAIFTFSSVVLAILTALLIALSDKESGLPLIGVTVIFSLGPLFGGHLFYRFAVSDEKKPQTTKVVYSGNEFSQSSLRNYGLFILFLAALVLGVRFWWQSLF